MSLISHHKERTEALTGSELAIIEDEDGLRGIQTSLLRNLARKARRFDWAAPHAYCGTANVDTLDNAPAWSIIRLEIASNGATATTEALNVAWSDRFTATYG